MAFVISPRNIEVEFPYGEVQDSEPPSSEEDETPHTKDTHNKRKREDNTDTENKGKNSYSRYSKNILTELIIPDLNKEQKTCLPTSMDNPFWKNKYDQLTSLAVSSSTWKCRLASFHKLKKFSSNTKTDIIWPLNQSTINGFIIWCFNDNQISANTTKTYLCHINSIQKLLGFKKFNLKKFNIKTLIKGFKNGENLYGKSKLPRETINFETLKEIKGKIFNQSNSKIQKKCLWGACSTAFFGCFRMGELLPRFSNKTEKKFDLLWKDINLSKKHASIVLKTQKNRVLNKQTLHLFKFKDKYTCPINALRKLKKQAKKDGTFSKSKPVFAFNEQTNLTQRIVNKFLKVSFPKNKFSGHSFRAGVPSSLADFPNIANDWHVMGWGRWRSSIFLKYQKRTKEQSKWVFKKIEKCLL